MMISREASFFIVYWIVGILAIALIFPKKRSHSLNFGEGGF
ncbi:MAG: hypothetical protein QNJ65_05855 [Xenococcaceae cyanobacterium MO_234.B1]|nr:hypothetical protein [Xenococcaceae cyanobacterium MO_234.B1]